MEPIPELLRAQPWQRRNSDLPHPTHRTKRGISGILEGWPIIDLPQFSTGIERTLPQNWHEVTQAPLSAVYEPEISAA
jgi:hypothetical protein